MRKTANVGFAWIIVTCLICHVAALLVVSAYHASGTTFAYTEPIRWRQLFDGFGRIDAQAIERATTSADWFLVAFGIVGLALVIRTRNQVRSLPRFMFFLVQPVLFYTGWVGLILVAAFPFEALKLDGEWLRERSPVLMSLGCWILACVFIALRSLKRPRGIGVS
jgi:hypothetical protein